MKIVDLLKEKTNIVSLGGVDISKIIEAENDLTVKFSDDYKAIQENFGVISFNGHELTGICKSKRLNVVDITVNERRNNSYVDNLYVLEKTNIDDVIVWQSNDGTIYQTKGNSEPVKIYNSLIEYLNK